MKEIIPHITIKSFFIIAFALLLGFMPLGSFSQLAVHAINNEDGHEESSSSGTNPADDETNDDNDSAEDEIEPPTRFDFASDLIIHSVHPGYTIDGNSVIELIELRNLSDASISLAGFSLHYTNGSGTKHKVVEFTEGSLMTGEFLLFRPKTKDPARTADYYYGSKIDIAARAGKLQLSFDGQELDAVCWGDSENCLTSFTSKTPTVLTRNLFSGLFECTPLEEYSDSFDSEHPSLILPSEKEEPSNSEPTEEGENKANLPPQCRGLEFSEIYTYYITDASEQFIELLNPTNETIMLDGCSLNYKKKNYNLTGKVGPGQLFVYYPHPNFTMTKNPSSSNTITLIDVNEEVVDELVYANGQKKGMSFARFFDAAGTESWKKTFLISPGKENVEQTFRTCPTGKVINPATGNCVNVSKVATSAILEPCPAGKYRNPLTGRCKNITTASTQKECAEGYERNPETNRCRKITKTNDGAEFAVVPQTYESKTSFISLGVVILLVSIGIIYAILQFRHEIVRMARKIRQRLHHILENLLSRKISFNQNKKP